MAKDWKMIMRIAGGLCGCGVAAGGISTFILNFAVSLSFFDREWTQLGTQSSTFVQKDSYLKKTFICRAVALFWTKKFPGESVLLGTVDDCVWIHADSGRNKN